MSIVESVPDTSFETAFVLDGPVAPPKYCQVPAPLDWVVVNFAYVTPPYDTDKELA